MQDKVLMDEQKEKDELGNNETESAVVSSEHVAGESEAVVESMDYEGEEGGSCNGDDIMVEVLGSHVYVDGICTTEGGGGFGGDANDKSGRGNEGSVNPESGNRDDGESDEKVGQGKEQGREEGGDGDAIIRSSDAEGETIKEDHCSENKDSASLSKETESGGDKIKNKVNQNNEPEDEHNSSAEIHVNASPDRHGVAKDENNSNKGEGGSDTEQAGSQQGQEMEVEEHDPDSEMAATESGISGKVQKTKYELPMEDEGEFSVSDLVWGKVRSHPWWPGQIFDPSDASEKAMKHHKKDSFLVAYFGDRTFAWNESSVLKPFRKHFSQIEKQSNSEAFQNAVECALEEVSRRVELGLACSCLPKDIYEKIRFQTVENAGIEDGLKEGGDRSFSSLSFEPDKFLEYINLLAESPLVGADRLELAIAKAQLLAFCRLRGDSHLSEFQDCGETTDHEKVPSGLETSQPQRTSYLKRKHNLKDIYPSKKERSDGFDSLDYENDSDGKANGRVSSSSSIKKRKAVDSLAEEGRKTISPKSSFKIGECIRRAASQMAGSPSIIKSNDFPEDGYDVPLEDSEMINPLEYSPDELLSQLQFAACDPLTDFSYSNVIVSFFSEFRNSAVLDRLPVDSRKFSSTIIGSETFEFEDMNDTYWTDRIVQNGSEEPLTLKRQYQIVPVELGKPIQKTRRGRKRYSDGTNHDLAAAKPPGYISENAPAEIVMSFPSANSVPAETKLNKMFRHFGPLKDSETEVDRETSRARVVFKKCLDAEVAFDSAGKFNIFGSVPVNYQLNYVISESFKASFYTPTLADETHFFATTQGEHTPPVSSTAGEGSHLISPTFGEEGSYMISHFDDATLSMPAPLSEETLHLATSLGEEAMTSFSTFGGENFPAVTSFYEVSHAAVPTLGMVTLAVPTSTYEEASTVVTTIGEESKIDVASTVCEYNAASPANEGEETLSTVPANEGEETLSTSPANEGEETLSTSPANEGEETLSTTPANEGEETLSSAPTVTEEVPTDTTVDEGAENVDRAGCDETSTAAQIVGMEVSTDTTMVDEGASGDATNLDKEIPVSATLDGEDMAVEPTTGDTTSTVATVADTTPAVTALDQESVSAAAVIATLGEDASDAGATMGEDTRDVSAAENEESVVATSLAEETSPVTTTSDVVSAPAEETSNVAPTSVEETSTVVTTEREETSTVVTTVHEETSTVTTSSLDDETTTVVTTVHEETSVATTLVEDAATVANNSTEDTPPPQTALIEETETVPTTSLDDETTTVVTTVCEETSTVATTLVEEAATVANNSTEDTPPPQTSLTEETETVPTSPVQETATTATSPSNETETAATDSGMETTTVAPALHKETEAEAEAEAATSDAPTNLGEEAPTDATGDEEKESPIDATDADKDPPTVVEEEKETSSKSPGTETSPTDTKPAEETAS